jgi:putative hemolysin
MSGYWVNIFLVGVLVVLNAVFAGSEIALISLREGQLRQLERRTGAGRARWYG